MEAMDPSRCAYLMSSLSSQQSAPAQDVLAYSNRNASATAVPLLQGAHCVPDW